MKGEFTDVTAIGNLDNNENEQRMNGGKSVKAGKRFDSHESKLLTSAHKETSG